eukprot:EG_transcript_54800
MQIGGKRKKTPAQLRLPPIKKVHIGNLSLSAATHNEIPLGHTQTTAKEYTTGYQETVALQSHLNICFLPFSSYYITQDGRAPGLPRLISPHFFRKMSSPSHT